MSWNDARTYCQTTHSTELASIHSLQDNTVAASAMGRGWIGFNDITTDGTWVWSDGTPSDYTIWSPNEPNGGTNENCGELFNGVWNDLPCGNPHLYFLCNHPS